MTSPAVAAPGGILVSVGRLSVLKLYMYSSNFSVVVTAEEEG